MMNNDDHHTIEPVNCDLHERYELAVMHRETLFIRWRDADGLTHLENLRPVDLRARGGEEFLHAVTVDGEPRVLRLDTITEVRKEG
ncbi:MAG TPA: transcriptional antiterminator, Rof [Gammaproteobacteria bacterium]